MKCDICHGRGYWTNTLDGQVPCTFCDEEGNMPFGTASPESWDTSDLADDLTDAILFAHRQNVKNRKNKMTDLRDKLNRDWADISSEHYRVYVYPDEVELEISFPEWLNVSESGGHRIRSKGAHMWYIPSGWLAVRWQNKSESQFDFVK